MVFGPPECGVELRRAARLMLRNKDRN